MICKRVEIDTIPACVWGMASTRVIVAVHGNMASKTDTATAHLAEFAVQAGWQVLSFDLPEHGDRKGRERPVPCRNAWKTRGKYGRMRTNIGRPSVCLV